jgi:adenylate cyclase
MKDLSRSPVGLPTGPISQRSEPGDDCACTTWTDNSLAAWLADHGGQSLGASALLDEICTRLCALGVPIQRANLALQDHHPQIAARGFRWIEGEGVTDSTYPLINQASLEYKGSPIAAIIRQGVSGTRKRLDRSEIEPDEALYLSLKAAKFTDYAAMALIFSDGSRHFISFATRQIGGFETEQLTMIYDLLPLMCIRFELDHSRLVTETLLNTYHGRRASARIRGGTIRRNQGERIAAILVYTDLRGFTRLADQHPAEHVTQALGEYYEAVAGPIEARGGDIIKMIGDGLLSIFTYEDPMMGPCENVQACEAVDAVLEGHANLQAIQSDQLPGSIDELRAGFALHTGTVTFGNVGSSTRLDFTAIGPAVNEVTRVEALTKTLGAPILATSRFAQVGCSTKMVSLGHHELRGVEEVQEIFTLAEFV